MNQYTFTVTIQRRNEQPISDLQLEIVKNDIAQLMVSHHGWAIFDIEEVKE